MAARRSPRSADQASEVTARGRDPAATQARILAAATAAFAQAGLAGARVDAIAARAGVNKRMIYHYFRSKDDLFLAVLERAWGGIRAAERRLDLEQLDPETALVRLAEFTWTYYLEHPEFLRLVNSENLHEARHLRRSRKIREMHSPFVRLIADLLARGVAEGRFRPGIDPDQLYISIAALGYYYLTNRFTLSVIYGTDLGAPEALERRRRVIVDMVLAYVRER